MLSRAGTGVSGWVCRVRPFKEGCGVFVLEGQQVVVAYTCVLEGSRLHVQLCVCARGGVY